MWHIKNPATTRRHSFKMRKGLGSQFVPRVPKLVDAYTILSSALPKLTISILSSFEGGAGQFKQNTQVNHFADIPTYL